MNKIETGWPHSKVAPWRRTDVQAIDDFTSKIAPVLEKMGSASEDRVEIYIDVAKRIVFISNLDLKHGDLRLRSFTWSYLDAGTGNSWRYKSKTDKHRSRVTCWLIEEGARPTITEKTALSVSFLSRTACRQVPAG